MKIFKDRIGRNDLAGLTFSFPAIAGLIAFIGVPFFLAIGLSFTNLKLGSPLPTRFVGVEQYQRVLSDSSFQRALINNLMFAAVVVPVQTGLALVLAVMLNQRLRGMTIFRALFFLPVVFPMALIAVVWTLIYAPGPGGSLNALIGALSFGALGPYDWLHNPWLALPSLIVLSVWQGVGFQMVVLLAGLQSIPRQLYEAAEIDSAGPVRQFIHITIPQLRNVLLFAALVTTILAFRVFDQVQIMTQGGPSDATTTVMFEAVQAAFSRQQIARASAMTVVFVLIVLVIAVIQRTVLKEEREIA